MRKCRLELRVGHGLTFHYLRNLLFLPAHMKKVNDFIRDEIVDETDDQESELLGRKNGSCLAVPRENPLALFELVENDVAYLWG